MSQGCHENIEQGQWPLPGRIMKDFKVRLKDEWEFTSWTRGMGVGKGRFLFQEEGTVWEKAWRLEISDSVRYVLSHLAWQEHEVHESKWWEQNVYSGQGPDHESWSLTDLSSQCLAWTYEFGSVYRWPWGGKIEMRWPVSDCCSYSDENLWRPKGLVGKEMVIRFGGQLNAGDKSQVLPMFSVWIWAE